MERNNDECNVLDEYANIEQIIKDTIVKGFKFNTRHGTIGIVVNYDETSGMYLYKDNFNDYHYEYGINIVGNRIENK